MDRVISVLIVSLMLVASLGGSHALKVGFYAGKCPPGVDVEAIILQKMKEISTTDADLFPVLLRLHFHDCFVRGCDASVLLNIPGSERTAPPNARLEGFAAIETIKAAIEAVCPNTVSCADILAFTARDGVRLAGGPSYAVPAGRRDGVISRASEAVANLPGTQMNVAQLTANFAKQGLTKDDMILLSGGHTIGEAACVHLDERIYKFPGSATGADPTIPRDFVAKMQKKCQNPGNTKRKFDLDTSTSSRFDKNYYSNLLVRKATLASDQVLFDDASTSATVKKYAADQSAFFSGFAVSMVKMGSNQVLEGTQGQIRKVCSHVN